MIDSSVYPYLSLVIASRNDNHGGNLRQRMQVSLGGLMEQLERYQIDSELLIIEWNPPNEKPPLKDVIKWPEKQRYCTVKIINVPTETHFRFKGSNKVPMIREIAVNCGIKRARGRFILPGAVDLLYSEELVEFLATKSLRTDKIYRIARLDVDNNAVNFRTLKEQLEYSSNHIIKINANSHTKHHWYNRNKLPDLFTNAAGDFQLMSKGNWHLIRGYSENYIFAYGDGILCYAAYAAGIEEVVLKHPLCLYHIDHEEKFNERKKDSSLPFENYLRLPFLPDTINGILMSIYGNILMKSGFKLKSTENGVPTLHPLEYRKMARDMISGKRSYVLNDENWGLGQDELEEHIINVAEWDREYARN